LTKTPGDEVELADVGTLTPKEKSTGKEGSETARSTRMVGNAAAEAAKKIGERCMVENLTGQDREV
jgi:hypothetical protein